MPEKEIPCFDIRMLGLGWIVLQVTDLFSWVVTSLYLSLWAEV